MTGRRASAGGAERGARELDMKALCEALGIPLGHEKTRKFLVLVKHDLEYMTDPVYRENYDRHLELTGVRRKSTSAGNDPDPKAKRGRPVDDIARALVVSFISRLESELELEIGRGPGKLGFSKRRSSKLREALKIYLGTTPDRHMPGPVVPWLSDAERAALDAPDLGNREDDPWVAVFDTINRAITKPRRR